MGGTSHNLAAADDLGAQAKRAQIVGHGWSLSPHRRSAFLAGASGRRVSVGGSLARIWPEGHCPPADRQQACRCTPRHGIEGRPQGSGEGFEAAAPFAGAWPDGPTGSSSLISPTLPQSPWLCEISRPPARGGSEN